MDMPPCASWRLLLHGSACVHGWTCLLTFRIQGMELLWDFCVTERMSLSPRAQLFSPSGG